MFKKHYLSSGVLSGTAFSDTAARLGKGAGGGCKRGKDMDSGGGGRPSKEDKPDSVEGSGSVPSPGITEDGGGPGGGKAIPCIPSKLCKFRATCGGMFNAAAAACNEAIMEA